MIYVDIQLLREAMGACRDFCTVVLAERALGLNTDQSRARALREIPGTSTILTLERDGEVIDVTLLDKRLVGLDARASKLQSHAVSMPGGVIRVYFDLSSRLVESHHGWRLVRDWIVGGAHVNVLVQLTLDWTLWDHLSEGWSSDDGS